MIIISFSILVFFIYASLIIYYRQSWISLPIYKTDLTTISHQPLSISVIIAARNEEDNIEACLESVVSQSSPKHQFEIIVVDDFSTDRTAEIAHSFATKNVRLISLKDFTQPNGLNSYKKKAIEVAISKAKGDLIITTDADCVVPNSWVNTIASFYETYHPVFVAAPVVFLPSAKGEGLGMRFLKIFQSLDFMTLQGITGASVYKKFHTMCNGANLVYEKKIFYEVGGFSGIDNLASGDDMLLMHKIFKKYPERTLFLKSRDVIVKTLPAATLHEFFNQRIRWASKSGKYADKKITIVLALVYLFNLWVLFIGIFSFFYHSIFIWFIVLLLSKTAVELFFLYPVVKFFKKEKLLGWFPLSQPFHILYIIIAGWLGKFGSYKWKGRKVK